MRRAGLALGAVAGADADVGGGVAGFTCFAVAGGEAFYAASALGVADSGRRGAVVVFGAIDTLGVAAIFAAGAVIVGAAATFAGVGGATDIAGAAVCIFEAANALACWFGGGAADSAGRVGEGLALGVA